MAETYRACEDCDRMIPESELHECQGSACSYWLCGDCLRADIILRDKLALKRGLQAELDWVRRPLPPHR